MDHRGDRYTICTIVVVLPPDLLRRTRGPNSRPRERAWIRRSLRIVCIVKMARWQAKQRFTVVRGILVARHDRSSMDVARNKMREPNCGVSCRFISKRNGG